MKIPKRCLVSVPATMMCLHNFSTNNQQYLFFNKNISSGFANSGPFSPENFPLYPNYKEKQNQYVI